MRQREWVDSLTSRPKVAILVLCCSSMVENLNSRVRPYLDEQKFVSQKILNLIQFYLNHKPFTRSTHKRLVNKSPAEAMTGKPHQPWLEMLGFPSVTKLVP